MPDQKPVISVIIPAYNPGKLILETLDSVFKQTFQDFEVVIVNDGSTDNCLELLESVQDPRVRIITTPNQGVCAARNTGIQLAKGDYFAFLDNDDLWTEDKLETQLKALRSNPRAGVVYSWTQPFYSETGKVCDYKPFYFSGNVYDDLLNENFIAHGSNILATRAAVESVGGYDERLPYVADWDYALRLAAKWEYVVVPKPQILYRLSSTSMSLNVETMENQFLMLFKKAQPFSKLSSNQLQQILSQNYMHLASICLSRSHSKQVVPKILSLFKKSLEKHPLSFLTNTQTVFNFLKICKIIATPQTT